VGATEERLRIQADLSETDCELNGPRIIEAGQNMKPKADPLVMAYLDEIKNRREGKKANPEFDDEMFNWVYATYLNDYEPEPNKIGLFRTFNDEGPQRDGTLFRWHDRVKLTWEIITGDKSEGGACFTATKYVGSTSHPLRAAFPLHSKVKLAKLQSKWMTWKTFHSQVRSHCLSCACIVHG
jgi:hypothetical protein